MTQSLEQLSKPSPEQLGAQSRIADAKELLTALEQDSNTDESVAELLRHTSEHGAPEDRIVADEVGGLSIAEGDVTGREVPLLLGEQPPDELGVALADIEKAQGEDALERIIERIEEVEQELAASHGKAFATIGPEMLDNINDIVTGEVRTTEAMTGMPEFDRLDDYTPEFPEQILMHRSNAELNEGDIVLPSDQVSAEMHEALNRERSFRSTSSPQGSIEYDKKLAHAGTRDFGEQYGQYLYVVEPLEGDTLKWGENFGADINRKRKAVVPAIDRSPSRQASTDSYTGKWHNEVVSTKGFRVVKKIAHEPVYGEAILPWPVTPDAIAKHKARAEHKLSNVAPPGSDTTPGYGGAFRIETIPRVRASSIGAKDHPGSYRAGATERNPAEWRTRFDVIKQNAEHPGQSALPGMSISEHGDPDRWKSLDVPSPTPPERLEEDTPLPDMENYIPPSRPMF